jgi:hypothetical protein
MRVRFENVIDGLNRYIDKEIYCNLNDVQEIMARLVIGRINQNAENIKMNFMNNGFLRTLCIVDSDGMVEADQLLMDLRREIERKGVLELEIPLIGKIKFKPEDVDVLKNEILRGQSHENY